MLREVGRKATFYMLKYVKNNCKGGKIWIAADCQPKRPPVPYSAATLELKWRSAKDTLNGQNFQL